MDEGAVRNAVDRAKPLEGRFRLRPRLPLALEQAGALFQGSFAVGDVDMRGDPALFPDGQGDGDGGHHYVSHFTRLPPHLHLEVADGASGAHAPDRGSPGRRVDRDVELDVGEADDLLTTIAEQLA